MNGNHFFWVVPLCLVIGGCSIFWSFQYLFDYTAFELTEKCVEKLYESKAAWEENLSYDSRVFVGGEYCYNDSGNIICPVRQVVNMT